MMQKPEGTDLPQEIVKHGEKKSCLLRHSKSTLGHCKIQNGQKKDKKQVIARRRVKSYGVLWTNVDCPVWRMQRAWGERNGAPADFVIEKRFSLVQNT